jgi:hypothetical protein
MTIFIPSPGVRRMLSLRMDAAHGTPTIWEKLSAAFGGGGANRASILAGEQRDFTQAEQDLVSIFQPVLHTLESTALTDLRAILNKVLSGAASLTSVAGAVSLVKTAITSEGGVVVQQAQQLGQTSLTTLVSAELAALGHVNLPAA